MNQPDIFEYPVLIYLDEMENKFDKHLNFWYARTFNLFSTQGWRARLNNLLIQTQSALNSEGIFIQAETYYEKKFQGKNRD